MNLSLVKKTALLFVGNDALSVERMQRKRHHGHLLARRQDGRVADRADRGQSDLQQ